MKKKPILAVAAILIGVVIVVIKLLFFPSVKDNYFALNDRSLQQVPAGLVVLRPTHYPFLRHEGTMFAPPPRAGRDNTNFWIVGRNAPLRDVLAAAYDEYPSRVMLPAGVPETNFDFLVTVKSGPRQHLQAAIRQKLGYVAKKETRETEVLALKVMNPALPGLAVSRPDERRNLRFDDIKLNFTNLPVEVVTEVLKRYSTLSVVDKTGLTNFYDFSLRFDTPTRRQLQNETTARAAGDKMVQELGLKLAPDTESMEVLVVTLAGP